MLHFLLAPEWAQLAALLSQVNPVDVAISGHRQSAVSEARHRTVEIAEHLYSDGTAIGVRPSWIIHSSGSIIPWKPRHSST